jgi:hypothetical protein
MKKIFIFIIGCILLIFIYFKFKKTNKIPKPTKFIEKPFLWLYWEGSMPDYIKMCKETIFAKCSNSFNIILLNEQTIHSYLPELKDKNLDFSRLKIAQKVDYYRILLLYKYGGLYMDMDILVKQDLIEIIEKLEKYDFVGFGCTGPRCKYGYGSPSNWLLASRPQTLLMKNILKEYEKTLDEFNKLSESESKENYHIFGKILIWKELDKLIQTGYTYYHYPNTVDGTRDKNGEWVTMGKLFSEEEIVYDDPKNLLIVVLYNSNLDDFDKKYREMTKEELLKLNINFVKFYKEFIKSS